MVLLRKKIQRSDERLRTHMGERGGGAEGAGDVEAHRKLKRAAAATASSGEPFPQPGGAMERERVGKWERVSGASYSPSVQAKWGRESAAMKAAAQSPAGRHFRVEEGEGGRQRDAGVGADDLGPRVSDWVEKRRARAVAAGSLRGLAGLRLKGWPI